MKKLIDLGFILLLTATMSATNILTLEDALKSAQNNNPELRTAASEMQSAQKSSQSSFMGLGPAANLNYSKRYSNPGSINGVDETSSLNISASQPLFNGGKVFLSSLMAENTYKIKKAAWRSKFLEVTTNTETKYYSVQSNREMVKALEKNLEHSSASLEIALAKYEAGILSNAELLQMRSEKLSRELTLINMRNAYSLSKLELADYAGITGDFEIEDFSAAAIDELLAAVNALTPTQQKSLEERLLVLGEKNNPTLQISQLGINNSKKARLMAAGNFLPSLNLSYTYSWDNTNIEEDFEGSSTLSLMASVPIFPLADNALDYQAARYDLRSSEFSYESTHNSIILAIRSSFLNLITSAKAVESARSGSEYAWETWQQMRANFEQGLVSANDLLSIEVMVINSDTSYITARQKLLESVSSLNLLLGLEEKAQLIEIINNPEE
ncbi:MAG: TolC family protein [Candidatus Cloacimonetes bacterium]|nr:TolC family protein [Candidatus Cloacimonadota bacterium]